MAKKKVAPAVSTLAKLEVRYVPVGSVRPNPYNPNRQADHEFELLKQSMADDGFTQPVVVTRIAAAHLADPKFKGFTLGELVVVDGFHRWKGAQELGWSEIPIVETVMGPEQMRVSTLRHNRARGREDVDLAAKLLRDIEELGGRDALEGSLQMDSVAVDAMLQDMATRPVDYTPVPADGTASAVIDSMSAHDAARRLREQTEDKVIADAESDAFSLVLLFSGDEAPVVRAWLGARPADVILAAAKQEAMHASR